MATLSATAAPPRAETVVEASRGTLLAGIALVSFASLLLELALTRLFSVVLFYHFAFLAVSIALLGLGAGGVFAYVGRDWLARWSVRQLGGAICAINAIALVVVLEIVLRVPVELTLVWHNFGRLTAIYFFAAVPFFFTGLLFSMVFARESHRIAQLYGADLMGGALACLAVVPLLNWIGGPNAVVFAALAMALASAVWAASARQRRIGFVLAGALLVLLAANHSGRLIDIVYAKGMRRDRPWMLYARWNAISRVEVDQQGEARYIVIDADASSAIMNVDPAKWDQTLAPAAGADHVGGGAQGYNWKRDLMSAAPAIANVLRPRGVYATIGPGGGVDVLRALGNGSPSVTGIEINPIIANDIMRGRYAEYCYHLYQRPEVRIHVGDGRSWIRSSREQFDVVQMTLVDTWASTAAGAFALSENNLYTVEAFREYFDHLKPDGFIAITRWEFKQPREALRVVSQAMEALRQMGIADARQHLIVVSDGLLDEDGQPVTVLAKKSPFTPEEQAAVDDHLRTTGDELRWLYAPFPANDPVPSLAADELGRLAFSALIQSSNPRAFARLYAYNVAPVSDSAPFFFFTFKTGEVVRRVLAGTGRGADWRNNLGIVVLGMVLLISVATVLAFLILPLLVHARAHGQHLVPLLYFVAVGLGYIMVEIALIQRFVLFLGHPTYALTVVVFLMLLSSGAGSLVSRHWLTRARHLRFLLALIAAVALFYILLVPAMLRSLVGLPLLLKLLLSGVLLVPLGFLMGMPFPTGLRALAGSAVSVSQDSGPLAGSGATGIEWAWGMNAASSVLGSVLAMVIAIHFGLNAALACAAAAYLSASALTLGWRA